jgi:hypothetical protein
MSNDRDRLIELIKNAPRKDVVYGDIKLDKPIQTVQTIADYLLANGVIVPPVKVGYYIWFIQNDRLVLGLVQNITVSNICPNGSLFADVYEIDEHGEIENEWSIPLCDFGKTVFLTKEEAEEKLKELSKNENK